jgi:hypothetical protein
VEAADREAAVEAAAEHGACRELVAAAEYRAALEDAAAAAATALRWRPSWRNSTAAQGRT